MIGRILVMLVAVVAMVILPGLPMVSEAMAHGRSNVRVVRAPIRAALGIGGGHSHGYSRSVNIGFQRSYVAPVQFQRSYSRTYVAPIGFQKSYAYVAPQVASYAYAPPVQYNHAPPVQYNHAPPIQCVTTPCVQPVQYQTGCSAYFAAPVAYSSVGYSTGYNTGYNTGGGCASLFGY